MAPRRGWGKGRGGPDPLSRSSPGSETREMDSQVRVASCGFLNRKSSEAAKYLCLLSPGALNAARESRLPLYYVAERNSTFQARHSSTTRQKIGERERPQLTPKMHHFLKPLVFSILPLQELQKSHLISRNTAHCHLH